MYVCVYLSISIDQQLRKGGYEFEREQGCGHLRESKGVDMGEMWGSKGKGQNIIIFEFQIFKKRREEGKQAGGTQEMKSCCCRPCRCRSV